MNLATRCTTCGTIFRVVQDQLRVSEGWVRCGRCAEVFDAREQLFDLERDSPPPWPPQNGQVNAPAMRPAPAPAPQQPAPPAPYHPYQGQPQGAAPARQAPPPAPMYAPEPAPVREPAQPPSFPSQSVAAAFDDLPRRFVPPPAERPPEARDSSWIANDDNSLNPFAPPRRYEEEDEPQDDLLPNPRQFSRPRHREVAPPAPRGSGPQRVEIDSRFLEDRREPFLEPPAAPEARSHLPEPKGMRFEEDELPPPISDDERPDALVALSPATAAQLKSQEPALDPRIPVRAPIDEGEPSMQPATDAGAPSPKPTRAARAAEKAAAKEAERAAKEAEKAAEKAAKEAAKEAERAAKEAEKAAKEAAKEAERNAKKQKAAKTASAPAPSVPSFMRKAESAQRWHRPWVRAVLGTTALVLVAGLTGQSLWQGREAIAAQYPFAKPTLMSMATAMGQEIKPWQHIEALSVESSSLNPAGEGNHYKLTLSLRNRSNWEVAQPWVDLSLTDAGGQLVVRRMLSPAEMQAGKASLAAGADQQLQIVFDSGATKISGYTVELFYP